MAVEKFNESDFSVTRLAGMAMLAGGSGVGIYKTLNSVPRVADLFTPKGGAFIEKGLETFKNIRDARGRIVADSLAKAGGVASTATFQDLLGNTIAHAQSGKLATKAQKMTTRQLLKNIKNPQLKKEVESFLSMFKSQGLSTPEIFGRMKGDELAHIRFLAETQSGKKVSFPLFVQNEAGFIYQGTNLQNRSIARQVDASFQAEHGMRMKQTAIKTIPMDVAQMQRYRTNLPDFMSGAKSAYFEHKTLVERAVFRDTIAGKKVLRGTGMSSAREAITAAEIIVDPFKGILSTEARLALLQRYTTKGTVGGVAITAGASSMIEKGVVTGPSSPLYHFPGMATSPSGSQLIRDSQFLGSEMTPTVNWLGEQFGTAGLGEMSYFKVAESEKGMLKSVMGHYSPAIGEIAAEEFIIDTLFKPKISNQLYTLKMNLGDTPTKTSLDIIQRMSDQLGISTNDFGRLAAQPGGIAEALGPEQMAKLNLNVRGMYLERRQVWQSAREDLSKLKQAKESAEKIAASQAIVDQAKKELTDFKILSIGEKSKTKIPTTQLDIFIKNATLTDGKLSFATETIYDFDVMQKTFGGGLKGTVKGVTNVSEILAQLEYQKMQGITDPTKMALASRDELARAGLIEKFGNVKTFGFLDPFKLSEGLIESRRVPDIISNYVATQMAYGSKLKQNQIVDLFALNRGGQGFNADPRLYQNMTGREMIEGIMDIERQHAQGPVRYVDVFKGQQTSIGQLSNVLISPDYHSIQTGAGKLGSFTERGVRNLMSMGLNPVIEDIMSRSAKTTNAFSQFAIVQDARNAIREGKVAGVAARDIMSAGSLGINPLFSRNLAERVEAMKNYGLDKFSKGGTLFVDLGREIGGIKQVPLFTNRALEPLIGAQIGSQTSLTELDDATHALIAASLDKTASPDMLGAVAKRYTAATEQVNKTIQKGFFGGKVKGSRLVQIASSVPGMDEVGEELARAAKMTGGQQLPVIAMTKLDIEKLYGKGGLAQSSLGLTGEKGLWDIVTREPIEGITSTVGVRVVAIEDVIAKHRERQGMKALRRDEMQAAIEHIQPQVKGETRIFLGGEKGKYVESLLRAGTISDFDKDMMMLMGVRGTKAQQSIGTFMVGEGGAAYREALEGMSLLGIKGKSPLDYMTATDETINLINARAREAEKGFIGQFSNEFKNVHIGLAEQFAAGGDAYQFYRGERLSHFFVENVIKSKHQTSEAMKLNKIRQSLSLLSGEGEYLNMAVPKKVSQFQSMIDSLAFQQADAGTKIRQIKFATIKEEEKGFLAKLFGMEDDFGLAVRKGEEYARVTGQDNLTNIFAAQKLGKGMQAQMDLGESIAARLSMSDDMIKAASRAAKFEGLMGGANRLIKNIGFYGVLPAAGIGLAASLFDDTPQVISAPVLKGIDHEANDSMVDMNRTVYAIPPSRTGYQIKGTANRSTNFAGLGQLASSSGGHAGLSVSDRRAAMDKYIMADMIEGNG